MPHISGFAKKVNNMNNMKKDSWASIKKVAYNHKARICTMVMIVLMQLQQVCWNHVVVLACTRQGHNCLQWINVQAERLISESERRYLRITQRITTYNLIINYCVQNHTSLRSTHVTKQYSAHLGSSWGESLITTWGRPPSLVRPIKFVKAKLSKQQGEIVKSKSIHTYTWAPRADEGSYPKIFQCENGTT